jgi:hypothetical protein
MYGPSTESLQKPVDGGDLESLRVEYKLKEFGELDSRLHIGLPTFVIYYEKLS